MSKLVNTLLKSSINLAQTSLETAMNTLKSIEVEDVTRVMKDAKSKMNDSVNKLKTQLHKIMDRHTIEIPFDKETNEIKYEINGQEFKVEITCNKENSSSRNVSTFILPEEVDTREMTQTYDEIRKVLVFKFKLNQ